MDGGLELDLDSTFVVSRLVGAALGVCGFGLEADMLDVCFWMGE